MAFLSSDSVTVFPSANRSGYPQSRLTSEQNLVGIFKHLTNKHDYVITSSIPTTPGNDLTIEFIIEGYYFTVNYSSLVSAFSSSTDIYAHIKIVGRPSGQSIHNTFNEIAPVTSGTATELDNDSNFEGLNFTTTDSSVNGSTHSLHLLTRANSSAAWIIPEASRLRFINDNSNRIISIDDGDLDAQ